MALGPNRVVKMTDDEQVLHDQLEEFIDEFMQKNAGTTLSICVADQLQNMIAGRTFPAAVEQALVRAYTKAGWYNVLYNGRDRTFTFFATKEDEARARD